MARRRWIVWTGAALLVLVAIGLGGAGFYFQRQKMQVREAFEKGNAAYDEGNFSQAEMYLGFYLHENRDDADTLLKYADSAMKLLPDRMRKFQKAAQAYQQVETLRPGDLDAVHNIIDIQVKKRAWQDLDYYSGLYLENLPDDPYLKFHRALAHDRLDHFDEAVNAYKALIAENTSYAECYFNLARKYESRNFGGEAARVFSDALAAKPDDAALRGQYARYLLSKKSFDLAKVEIDMALAGLPGDAQLLTLASQTAMALEQWDEAIDLAGKAIATGKAQPEAYLAATVAYERKQDIPGAIAFLDGMDKATRVDSPEIFMTHVELLTITSRLAEADALIEEYRKIYPDNYTVLGYLDSRLLLARGNAKKAALQLTSMVETKPDFRQAQYYLILALLESNDLGRARVNLETFVRSFPDDSRARALLDSRFGTGQTLARASQAADRLIADPSAGARPLIAAATALYDQAIRTRTLDTNGPRVFELLTKAIAADPMTPESYPIMVELLTYQGDLEKAEAVLAAATEAGLPAESTRLPRAAILLSKKDSAGANAIYENEVLGAPRLTVNEAMRWAEFLARRATLDSGLTALEKALPKMSPEDRASILVEPVSLCIRLNELDRARELLAALDQAPSESADAAPLLEAQKEALIQAYAGNGPSRNPSAALALVRELDAATPGKVDIQVLLARVLMRMDPPETEEAKKVAEALLEEHSTNPGVVTTLATLAMERQDYKAALDYAKRATLLDPNNLETQMSLAELQLRLNFFKDAIVSLERARDIDPSSLHPLELLAEAYLKNGDLPNAEAAAQSLVSRAASDAPEIEDRLKLLLSRIQLEKGENLDEATEVFRKRHAANPGNLAAASDLSVALARQDKAGEAESILQAFVDSNEGNADAWVALGRFYLAQRRNSEASRSLSRALILNRDQPDALRTMIAVQMGQGDKAGVIDLIDRYLGMQPGDGEIWYRKALALAQSEEPARAMEAIERAISIGPNYEWLYLRSVLRIEAKLFRPALEDLDLVVEKYPVSSAPIELSFARAYLGLKDLDAAREHFDDAIRRTRKDDAAMQGELAAFKAQLDAPQ